MMAFGWILIILLLIGALLFSRVLFPNGTLNTPKELLDSPIDIAKARYAKGEINKDEFERIKHGLQGGSA